MKEFEEIYRLHYSYVYKFLYRTCQNDHHLAEELTQETFYQAFRSMHRYNGKCSIETWLCSIAKNICFHHIRKHKDICLDLESLEETLYDDYEKTPEAYAELYPLYIVMKTDLANGDAERYNNSALSFKNAYAAFANYYNRTHLESGYNSIKLF